MEIPAKRSDKDVVSPPGSTSQSFGQKSHLKGWSSVSATPEGDEPVRLVEVEAGSVKSSSSLSKVAHGRVF